MKKLLLLTACIALAATTLGQQLLVTNPNEQKIIESSPVWESVNPVPAHYMMQIGEAVPATGFIFRSPFMRDKYGAAINPNTTMGVWVKQIDPKSETGWHAVQLNAEIAVPPSSWEMFEHMREPRALSVTLEVLPGGNYNPDPYARPIRSNRTWVKF